MFPFPQKDPEAMTLEMVAERVLFMALYSLDGYLDQYHQDGTPIDIDNLVKEVSDKVYKQADRSRKYPFRRSYKANRDRPSKAFLTNIITFNAVKPYKNALLRRHRAREISLDSETLRIWFIEDLINRAIDFHWNYVVTAILKILFIYEQKQLTKLQKLLERFQLYEHYTRKDVLRRWKSQTIRDMRLWFGESLVKLATIKVGSRREVHFKRPQNPAENFAVAVECMAVQALPRHRCVFSNTEVKSEGDIIRVLEKLDIKDADVVERLIMHLLICPNCLFPMLRALGFGSDTAQKLGLPLFMVDGQGGGQGLTSVGRRDIAKRLTERKIDIKMALKERNTRRKKLSLEYVLIAVDDVIRRRIYFDEPGTVDLNLKVGESILEVRGEDAEGSLPLEVRYIPWDSAPEGGQSYDFVTKLKGGRKLKFSIIYQTDEFGQLSGATARITHAPKTRFLPSTAAREPQTVWPTLAKVAAGIIGLAPVVLAGYTVYNFLLNPTDKRDANNAGLASIQSIASSELNPSGKWNAPTSKTSTPTARDTGSRDNFETRNEVARGAGSAVSDARPHINKRSGGQRAKSVSPKTVLDEPQIARSRRSRMNESLSISRSRRGRATSPNSGKPFFAVRPFASLDVVHINGIVTDTNGQLLPIVNIAFELRNSRMRKAPVVSGQELMLNSKTEGYFSSRQAIYGREHTKFDLYSNTKGYFKVCNLTVGTYDLVIKEDGYETRRMGLRVREGMKLPIHIKLGPERETEHGTPARRQPQRYKNDTKQSDFVPCQQTGFARHSVRRQGN